MKNRVPTKPNRYAVYDDSHNFLRYEYHERADEPASGDEGSTYSKENCLPDALCTLLGIATTSELKDALSRLNTLVSGVAHIATGSFTPNGTARSISLGVNAKFLVFWGTPACTSLGETIYTLGIVTTAGIMSAESASSSGQGTPEFIGANRTYYASRSYLNGTYWELLSGGINNAGTTAGTVNWAAIY